MYLELGLLGSLNWLSEVVTVVVEAVVVAVTNKNLPSGRQPPIPQESTYLGLK